MNLIDIFQNKPSRIEFKKNLDDREMYLLSSWQHILGFLINILDENYSKSRLYLNQLIGTLDSNVHSSFEKLNLNSFLPFFYSEFNKGNRSPVALQQINEFLYKSVKNYHDIIYGEIINDIDVLPAETILSDKINNKIKVDCFMRKHWWEHDPTTRLHGVGPRTVNGFRKSNINCDLYESGINNFKSATLSLSSKNINIAVVDFQSQVFQSNLKSNEDLIIKFLKSYDFVIALFADAWRTDAMELSLKYANIITINWVQSHEQVETYKKTTGNSGIFFPCPKGVDDNDLLKIVKKNSSNQNLSFIGSIEDINISRIFWRSMLEYSNINFEMHNHKNDNLSPIQSHLNYLERLGTSGSCLNFSTRLNGFRSPTARSDEVLSIGRLLVQEYSPSLRKTITPNKHYLEFRNVHQLYDISENILKNPKIYNDIAIEGYNFHLNNYDDKLLGRHITAILSLDK